VVDKRDQQVFDGFMILVGIFVGIIAGVILLGHLVGDGEGMNGEEGAAQSAVIERIEPIGAVALVGDPAPAAAPVMAAAPAPAAEPLSGEQVYQQLCSACHTAGVAGAPMLSDAASWEPRIAQGEDVLRDHVINGFQGSAGVMPAKGGRADLSNDEVIAAMQYMLDQVTQ
jgi:cytochrome c5